MPTTATMATGTSTSTASSHDLTDGQPLTTDHATNSPPKTTSSQESTDEGTTATSPQNSDDELTLTDDNVRSNYHTNLVPGSTDTGSSSHQQNMVIYVAISSAVFVITMAVVTIACVTVIISCLKFRK